MKAIGVETQNQIGVDAAENGPSKIWVSLNRLPTLNDSKTRVLYTRQLPSFSWSSTVAHETRVRGYTKQTTRYDSNVLCSYLRQSKNTSNWRLHQSPEYIKLVGAAVSWWLKRQEVLQENAKTVCKNGSHARLKSNDREAECSSSKNMTQQLHAVVTCRFTSRTSCADVIQRKLGGSLLVQRRHPEQEMLDGLPPPVHTAEVISAIVNAPTVEPAEHILRLEYLAFLPARLLPACEAPSASEYQNSTRSTTKCCPIN